jgi:hypothetical protein
MRLSSWLARARGDIDDGIAAVVFTKPERDLQAMDVAKGPCVPVGRRKPLVDPLLQDLGEVPSQTAALLTVLTGEPADGALEVVARRGKGVLHVCSERFLNAMADANEELVRLSEEDKAAGDGRDLPRFSARMEEYDRAWRAATDWPPKARSIGNGLGRMGWARIARERGQSLYCWHGRSVPLYRIVSGTGPYPGRGG